MARLFCAVLLLAGLLAAPPVQAKPDWTCSLDQRSKSDRNWLVEFATGKASLDKKADNLVREAAGRARDTYAMRVCVVGHASKQGDAKANQMLAERRARAVAKALTDLKVPPSTIRIDVAGEAFGAALGWLRNNVGADRSVEIYFVEN